MNTVPELRREHIGRVRFLSFWSISNGEQKWRDMDQSGVNFNILDRESSLRLLCCVPVYNSRGFFGASIAFCDAGETGNRDRNTNRQPVLPPQR